MNRWCRHYNGMLNETCKAGVNYRALAGNADATPLNLLGLPCVLISSATPCASLDRPTVAEAQAEEDEFMQHAAGSLLAIQRARKIGKGRAGVIECPICRGKLSVAVSSFNGHTQGRCATEGCLQWIE